MLFMYSFPVPVSQGEIGKAFWEASMLAHTPFLVCSRILATIILTSCYNNINALVLIIVHSYQVSLDLPTSHNVALRAHFLDEEPRALRC